MSDVDICNLALGFCSISRQVEAIDGSDESVEALQCQLLYPQARDNVLEDHPWPFAERSDDLALVSDADEAYTDEWFYAYRYPADCVRALRIVNPAGRLVARIPFRVAGDGTARLILSDQPDAVLAYTARVTDTAQYPRAFQEAVAWKLAGLLVLPMSLSIGLRDRADAGYAAAMIKAGANSENEAAETRTQDNAFHAHFTH